ncbi:MAG: hypothetical protein KatS3mg111_2435 [Pirellulaceae bacterium]|nr:MAG: hypothetical protein KatS3mg111_2435 [Pirellulaceae bacterium]
MKKLFATIALGCAAAMATPAEAAEPNLKALGLGNMKVVSHEVAKEVRGQGGIVWGTSFARIGPSFSTNSYYGWGPNSASGWNISGVVTISPFRAVVAGGYSTASGN